MERPQPGLPVVEKNTLCFMWNMYFIYIAPNYESQYKSWTN